MHLATLASAHCARPATGVTGARLDKDIPPDQAFLNPDDARPIVRHPTDLPEPGREPRDSDGTAGAVVQRP